MGRVYDLIFVGVLVATAVMGMMDSKSAAAGPVHTAMPSILQLTANPQDLSAQTLDGY